MDGAKTTRKLKLAFGFYLIFGEKDLCKKPSPSFAIMDLKYLI